MDGWMWTDSRAQICLCWVIDLRLKIPFKPSSKYMWATETHFPKVLSILRIQSHKQVKKIQTKMRASFSYTLRCHDSNLNMLMLQFVYLPCVFLTLQSERSVTVGGLHSGSTYWLQLRVLTAGGRDGAAVSKIIHTPAINSTLWYVAGHSLLQLFLNSVI